MTDQVSLNPRGLKTALEVLRREQVAYLPTARQNKLYRAFNISAFLMTSVAVLGFIVMSMADGVKGFVGETISAFLTGGLLAIAFLLTLSTAVLFVLNWGLIRKLYRHAQLRRRLKLANVFEPEFGAERRATRVRNAITMLIIVLGALLALAGLFGLVGTLALWIALAEHWLLYLVTPCLIVMAVGLGLGSLHFMRRGKQRLEVVLRLQDTLAKQAADPAQAAEVRLSTDEYAAIASLERAQIIRDRASSIASARKQASAPGYMSQTSRQMYEAKSRLPPEVLARVEATIAGLLVDPAPAGARDDPARGTRTVPVAGTSLRIQFEVDPDRHLVRLHDLGGEAAEARAMEG